jgi:hypothetical protein
MVGQGVWFLTTHYPDNVIAAAPVSGYSSIESKATDALQLLRLEMLMFSRLRLI